MENNKGKSTLGSFAALAIVAIIAAVLLVWGGANINNDIDQLAKIENYNLVMGDNVRVAGVEVEQVEMNVDLSDQTVMTMDIEIQPGDTAMDALKQMIKLSGLAFDTTQYDFGEIVDQIGDLRGGQDDKYWIYYVNGESAVQSADTNVLNAGDVVEFKFEKSIF